MLPHIELFGKSISTYALVVYFEYLIVPIILILFRKRYGFKASKAFLYGLLTLVIGTFALYFTQFMENWILSGVSNGAYSPAEDNSSFGYFVFMPPLFLLFCVLFGVDFRKITDYITLPLTLICATGKLACVFAGCCGGPADSNGLYMQYPGYKVFPVQLYETLLCAAIFVVCIVLTYTLSKKHTGYIMPIGGILYSAVKMWAESYRTWYCEWEQNFLNSGHTYWFYFEILQLVICVVWLVCTIICEITGKMPKFETNRIKRMISNIREKRREKLAQETESAE